MSQFKVLLLLIPLLVIAGCFPSSEIKTPEVLLQGQTMGTTYTIKFVDPKPGIDKVKLQAAIDVLLLEVNQQMSTYIADSELSQFNQHNQLSALEISSGLQRVLNEAIRLWQLSEGKLDVSVGPLVNLWGFGPEYRIETAPTEQQLLAVKENIGLENLTLSGNKLSKKVAGLYIDLSTIAKGYGVDIVAEYLQKQGIAGYLVEIGGEMRVKGFKATGELWHIAIEKPITEQRSVHQVIVPKDNAVATSGDYRNYFEENGQRYSHIIDPDTGKPIDHKLVSVTVIHPSAMTADGLSTAMMVMGEQKALAFAEKNKLAAYLISKTDNGFVEQSTVKFMQYLK